MQLPALFLRLAHTAPELSEPVQHRIHRFAVLKKDEDVAAALARRPDTVEAIDAELGSWSSAKVQAAWFARPGRSAEMAAAKVAKERRVTVLEVVAALEGLPASVYLRCAERKSTRVCLPLLTNESAPEKARTMAASVVAADFGNLSYTRRNALGSILSTCPNSVASVFVASMHTVDEVAGVLRMVGEIDRDAAEHVLALAEKSISSIPARRAAKLVDVARMNSRYFSFYEFTNEMRAVAEMVSAIASTEIATSLDFTSLVDVTATSKTEIENASTKRSEDDQLIHYIDTVRNACVASGAAVGSAATVARSAGSAAALLELLTNNADRAVAVAALCNKHADAKVAEKAMGYLGFQEPSKLLEARSRDMSLEVKAAIMVRAFNVSDERIRTNAAPFDPAALWAEMVRQGVGLAHGTSHVLAQLLSSSYASVDAIPTLPLKMFADESTPGWAITGLLAYLEEHLTTQAAWDGFELLAPKHLGDVQTVVRAASRTVRPTATTTAADDGTS